MLLRRYTLSQYLDHCLFLEERTLGDAAEDVLRIGEQSNHKLHKGYVRTQSSLLCLLLRGPERVCAQLLCAVTGTGVFGCLSGEEGTGLNCFKSYQQCCWNFFLPRQGILKMPF